MKVNSIFNHRLPCMWSASSIVATIVFLAMTFPSGPAQAQNTGMQELLNRVDRLQRELSTLQRQVYKGEAPPPAAAMTLAPAAGDPRNAARNSIRISQLENELQTLTGRIEEIGFRTQQIQSRLEKLVSDMDRRLTALEGGTQRGDIPQGGDARSNVGLALQPPPAAAAPAGGPGVTPLPSPPQAAATPGVVRGAAPRVLGTIPAEMAVSSPRGPATVPPQPPLRAQPAAPAPQTASANPARILPDGPPKAQYDYALSLMLKKQDFASAETALQAFIKQNPDDELAGNAHYWLGETYYVRNSFQDAAFAFAEGFQKFPKGNKAPDSLLKLGMSLDRLDKRREACTAYSRLLSTFPDLGARMKARVEREQSQAKCR